MHACIGEHVLQICISVGETSSLLRRGRTDQGLATTAAASDRLGRRRGRRGALGRRSRRHATCKWGLPWRVTCAKRLASQAAVSVCPVPTRRGATGPGTERTRTFPVFRFLKAFLNPALDEIHLVSAVNTEEGRAAAVSRQRDLVEADLQHLVHQHVRPHPQTHTKRL